MRYNTLTLGLCPCNPCIPGLRGGPLRAPLEFVSMPVFPNAAHAKGAALLPFAAPDPFRVIARRSRAITLLCPLLISQAPAKGDGMRYVGVRPTATEVLAS